MKTETKQTHTPGPIGERPRRMEIIVQENGHGPLYVVVAYFGNDKFGCEILHTHNEANARLIAAAPELLEALRKAFLSIESVIANMEETPEAFGGSRWAILSMLNEDAKLSRAAIAKAEGRS